MDIIDAVLSLNPKAELTVEEEDYSKITWRNGTIPIPQADIETELNRLRVIYDALAYSRARKIEYDSLNQFEMQYDDKKNGTTTWEDAIAKVKSDNPKPE